MHIEQKNSLAKLQVGRIKFHHNSNFDLASAEGCSLGLQWWPTFKPSGSEKYQKDLKIMEKYQKLPKSNKKYSKSIKIYKENMKK